MNLPDGDPRHGLNGYTNLSCRCAICRAAIADYAKSIRAVRARRIIADPSLRPHGVESTYLNWSCRCTPCIEAHRVRRAEREGRGTDRRWPSLGQSGGAA